LKREPPKPKNLEKRITGIKTENKIMNLKEKRKIIKIRLKKEKTQYCDA